MKKLLTILAVILLITSVSYATYQTIPDTIEVGPAGQQEKAPDYEWTVKLSGPFTDQDFTGKVVVKKLVGDIYAENVNVKVQRIDSKTFKVTANQKYSPGQYALTITGLTGQEGSKMTKTYARYFSITAGEKPEPTGRVNFIQGTPMARAATNALGDYTVDATGLPYEAGNVAVDMTTGEAAGLVYESTDGTYEILPAPEVEVPSYQDRQPQAIVQSYIDKCGHHEIPSNEAGPFYDAQVGDIVYYDAATHMEDIGVITMLDPAGAMTYVEIACQERETQSRPVDPIDIVLEREIAPSLKYTGWEKKIDGNMHHTVFIKDGNIYWMGGTGSQRRSKTPVLVQTGNFTQIAATLNGFIALDSNGNLWESQNGEKATQDREIDGVINIAAGNGFHAVLTSDGQVRVKGSNEYGQHGTGISGGNNAGKWGDPAQLPAGTEPAQVAAGGYRLGIITKGGDVYMWGQIKKQKIAVPKKIDLYTAGRSERLEIGDEGSIVITPDEIYAWDLPEIVAPGGSVTLDVGDRAFKKVIFKNRVIYALREDGLIFSSGDNNNFGQLGLGHAAGTKRLGEFYLVKTGTGRMLDIGAGRNTGYAFDSFGKLWSWGQNTEGQLGLGFSGQGNNYHPVMVKIK